MKINFCRIMFTPLEKENLIFLKDKIQSFETFTRKIQIIF